MTIFIHEGISYIVEILCLVVCFLDLGQVDCGYTKINDNDERRGKKIEQKRRIRLVEGEMMR
jgi:hypothetical protein